MERTDTGARPQGSLRTLLVILGLLALAFLILLPRLMAMMENARKIEQQNEAAIAEAGKLTGAKMMANTARAEAFRKPEDPESQMRAAHALSQAGMLEESARHAEIAAALDPANAQAWILLGEHRRRERRIYDAIRAFRSALRAAPESGQAVSGLASLYIALGWRKDVNDLLEPAIRKRPGDLPLKVAMALASMQSDDYKRAEELLLEVRAAAPEEVRLWSPLANLYNTQRRFEDAAKAAGSILDRIPNELAVRNELGIALFRMNRMPEAMDAFRQVLAVDSANVTARYNLALCLQRSGDNAGALREMEKVHGAAPGFEQTRYILGKLYLQSGRAEEGRRLLAESRAANDRGQRRARLGFRVTTHPDDPEAHFDLARLYHEDSETQRAIAELHKTLELQPAHAGARKLLTALENDK